MKTHHIIVFASTHLADRISCKCNFLSVPGIWIVDSINGVATVGHPPMVQFLTYLQNVWLFYRPAVYDFMGRMNYTWFIRCSMSSVLFLEMRLMWLIHCVLQLRFPGLNPFAGGRDLSLCGLELWYKPCIVSSRSSHIRERKEHKIKGH